MSENKPFICFHASRYTNKEKDRIMVNGLKTSSIENLVERIDMLLKDGYISESELRFLKDHNLLAKVDNKRENQLWVTLGKVDIFTISIGLHNVYNNLDGEIIYCWKKNIILVEKIKRIEQTLFGNFKTDSITNGKMSFKLHYRKYFYQFQIE